jgi:D-proline reductase (dithiol) PrdB
MADTHELSLFLRAFLKTYRWRRVDPVPWTRPRKPFANCSVALISTAGFVLPGQPPFDEKVKGGDWSFREIPNGIDPSTLIETHRSESFDHHGIDSDPNLAFPITPLNEMARANRRHFSFMGSITAPGRLMKESAPAVARMLVEDGVDVALLVPV